MFCCRCIEKKKWCEARDLGFMKHQLFLQERMLPFSGKFNLLKIRKERYIVVDVNLAFSGSSLCYFFLVYFFSLYFRAYFSLVYGGCQQEVLNNHLRVAATPGVVFCCKRKITFKHKNKHPGKEKLWKPHFIKPKLKEHQDFTSQKQFGW